MGVFVESDDLFEDWLNGAAVADELEPTISIYQSNGKSMIGVIIDAKKVFSALYNLCDYIYNDDADEYVDQQLSIIADQFSMAEIELENNRILLKH